MKTNRAIVWLLALVFLSGCMTAVSKKTGKALLQERVDAYMQAKENGNWAAVYPFFDSSTKKQIPAEKFKHAQRALSIKSYQIEKIEILPSGKEADVVVKSLVSFQMYEIKDTDKQKWIIEENNWYVKGKLPPKTVF